MVLKPGLPPNKVIKPAELGIFYMLCKFSGEVKDSMSPLRYPIVRSTNPLKILSLAFPHPDRGTCALRQLLILSTNDLKYIFIFLSLIIPLYTSY